jgi:DNA-binding NtrC family response regulator
MAMAYRVLVVDDEKLIRWSLTERLKKEGFEPVEAADGATATAAFSADVPDLVLLDMKLPDTDGLTLLKGFQASSPETPVIIITAYSSVDTAVEAMKQGAYDYLTKPFNMEELAITVRRAIEATGLKREASGRLKEAKERYGVQNLVGASKRMQEIIGLVRKVARSEASTVLLRGESGTGKDVVARAIHYESLRAEKPFMNITCTALPDTLLESELFGHEKGSFTDAKAQKKGLLELAEGGSVFLDEIGDMSANLQAKLLRVLEEKTFRRVGGTQDIRVNVRIIAATNRDLEKAIQERSFREDLYYRLNIIPIGLPPLRARRDDIPALVDHFVRHYNREFKRGFRGVSREGLSKLGSYDWPGNIRELRNVMERACLLATGAEVEADDLLLGRGAYTGAPAAADEKGTYRLPPNGLVLEDLEKDLVRQALERTGGNQTRAAELLGISRDQLRYRMEKHGIPARA